MGLPTNCWEQQPTRTTLKVRDHRIIKSATHISTQTAIDKIVGNFANREPAPECNLNAEPSAIIVPVPVPVTVMSSVRSKCIFTISLSYFMW